MIDLPDDDPAYREKNPDGSWVHELPPDLQAILDRDIEALGLKLSFYYRLDENEQVVPSPTYMPDDWPKDIAKTYITTRRTHIFISTVFLGVDHGHGLGNAPVVFETMLFGPSRNDEEQLRYTTINEARLGHQAVVAIGLLLASRGARMQFPTGRRKRLCQRYGHVELVASDGSIGCSRCGTPIFLAPPMMTDPLARVDVRSLIHRHKPTKKAKKREQRRHRRMMRGMRKRYTLPSDAA